MATKSRQKVRNAVEIEPKRLARTTPTRPAPVREDIWKTAMRLTNRNLKGMTTHGHLCVTFPVESLTPEGRKELGLKP